MKPREKTIERGISSLTDIEVISMLIGTGCKGRDYRKVASSVAKFLKNMTDMGEFNITIDDLTRIQGIGKVKALVILAAIELARRYNIQRDEFKTKLSTRKDVADHLAFIAENKQENLFAISVNTRYELIAKKRIALGSMDKLNISIRDIIRFALDRNAYGLILAHNHPSGDPTPSEQDMNVTKKIKDACALMDIDLIDHVIISRGGWRGIDL